MAEHAIPGDSASAPPDAPDIAGLEPLARLRRGWPAVLSIIISVAMVAGLVREMLRFGLDGLSVAAPDDWRFYLFFTFLYLNNPFGDFVIFRRLWGLPLGGGLAALLKKRIANEVVLGYSGEVYFYLWARQRASMVAAPFGAVKDVSILSAIAGNALSLVMLALALTVGADLMTPSQYRTAAGSFAIVTAISLPFLIFSKRVFSLPVERRWWIFGIHCLRIISSFIFIAAAWHMALPAVSISMWMFLAGARLLSSRIPLATNPDLLFANFAIILIGEGEALSQLVAFTAALTLVTHIVLTAGFGLDALIRSRR